MEQPLAGHRLRKAALAGGQVMFVNPRDFDFRFPVAAKVIADPAGMVAALAGVAQAVAELKGQRPAGESGGSGRRRSGRDRTGHRRQLGQQCAGDRAAGQSGGFASGLCVVAGAGGFHRAGERRATGLSAGSRQFGGRLAGRRVAAPPAGRQTASRKRVWMRERWWKSPRKAYVLVGVEPELDCWNGAAALNALQAAELVVALSPYASQRYARDDSAGSDLR